MKRLSVIIVNYRSWDCLERCLQDLEPAIDEEFEVIVVDNHSNDGRCSSFAARHPRVRFLECALNGGFAYGCNRGAAEAAGQTFLFLNPDVYTNASDIRTLALIKHAVPHVAILAAAQFGVDGKPQKAFDVFPHRTSWLRVFRWMQRKCSRKAIPHPRKLFTGLVECDWVSGSVLMIDRETFKALGGWSEQYFMYAEDYDLCYRASLRNLRVACTGDIRMLHAHGGSSRQSPEVSVQTRTEAIISKHVFNQLHFRGMKRQLYHLSIMMTSLPDLLLLSLFDMLTLRRVASLRIRSGILLDLSGHYLNVIRGGQWFSRRLPLARQGLH